MLLGVLTDTIRNSQLMSTVTGTVLLLGWKLGTSTKQGNLYQRSVKQKAWQRIATGAGATLKANHAE